ncbi:unnamed protein product [Closterium sp. Naga37s-1]|nr:unnamed protein product [Closterium sp. Naga37s-1]
MRVLLVCRCMCPSKAAPSPSRIVASPPPSPSPNQTVNNSSNSSLSSPSLASPSGLSVGAVIGIVTAAVLLVPLLLALAWCIAAHFKISTKGRWRRWHHPNLVQLLGYAVGGHVNTRVENILVYEFIANGDLRTWIAPGSFGVLMLVMLSGRGATINTMSPGTESDACASHEPISISKWAADLMAEGKTSPLRDPRMEAPDDITIRLAHLAVTCTAMPTASRPSMSRVAQDLEALRDEAGGGDARARAAARVDEKLSNQRLRRSMEEDLALLNEQVKHEGDFAVTLPVFANMSGRQGGKLKPLKQAKAKDKDYDEADLAYLAKKKEEEKALKDLKSKAAKGAIGGAGLKKSGK